MSSKLVALIIGAGSNVGASVAQTLARNSYKVAAGSRQTKPSDNSEYYPFSVDVMKPETVKAAFENVTAALGPPNVVIYNVGTFTRPPVAGDPLSLPYESFVQDQEMLNSFYLLAQESVKAFRAEVHKDHPKVFIITGNMLAFLPAAVPRAAGLGALGLAALTKVSNAYLMDLFSTAYSGEGMRFHYAHYVSAEGAIPPLSSDAPESFFKSGPAHAEAYWRLISSETPLAWDYRFTWDGKEYKDSKSDVASL